MWWHSGRYSDLSSGSCEDQTAVLCHHSLHLWSPAQHRQWGQCCTCGSTRASALSQVRRMTLNVNYTNFTLSWWSLWEPYPKMYLNLKESWVALHTQYMCKVWCSGKNVQDLLTFCYHSVKATHSLCLLSQQMSMLVVELDHRLFRPTVV